MNWLQIVIMIAGLLRELKKSNSREEFQAGPQALKAESLGSGQLLNWLWENREQIIAFAVMLFERFSSPPSTEPQAMTDGTESPEAEAKAQLEGLASDLSQ